MGPSINCSPAAVSGIFEIGNGESLKCTPSFPDKCRFQLELIGGSMRILSKSVASPHPTDAVIIEAF